MHPAEASTRRPAAPQPGHAAPLTYTLAAAAASGLSRSTLYRHAAARLRLVKVGGRTLVDAASLRALVGAGA